ncbi:unnamed protein product [Leptidea sinapis]|uniref:Uncharacterized protein n=1 Tax=Leptidea sinapis TaxID=189913 RepID=A0A5E4Q3I2_9NEOP|nr:unnamed protein product [Leptidea sinapis]
MKNEELSAIEVYDLTRPTLKLCVSCGIPALGTGLHLEHAARPGTMQPALIPAEYLLTRCKYQSTLLVL